MAALLCGASERNVMGMDHPLGSHESAWAFIEENWPDFPAIMKPGQKDLIHLRDLVWLRRVRDARAQIEAMRRVPAGLPAPSSEWDSAIDSVLEALTRAFPEP
jgi:hypothetical protein